MKITSKSKLSLVLCFVAIICSLSIVLCACNLKNSGKTNGAHLSVNEFYGVGSVTTVKLLGDSMPVMAMNTFSTLSNSTMESSQDSGLTSSSENIVKDQAETFNKYFSALDSFLGEDTINVSNQENTDEAYASYAKKLTINGKDIAGNDCLYVMYYNETLNADSSVVDEDDTQDGDKNDDEVESNYQLNGVLVVGEVTYTLAGERSSESEIDETEEELKIRAFLEADPNNYVEMTQEVSEEENEREIEYVYRVYNNNILVEETAIKFENEQEDGKAETEFELEFIKGDSVGKYKVEKEIENGNTKINVKYDIDGKVGDFTVAKIISADATTYEYTFTDNSKKVYTYNN